MNIRNQAVAAVVFTLAFISAAFAADWPNFHGADRANRSRETGLLREWPQGGPRLLWTASGIGEGYSGVSVANGVIYTAGIKDNANFVFAFDRDGAKLWERQAGPAWQAARAWARAYHGTRSTPTVSDGVVYYLSDSGILSAFDARTGAPRWSHNLQTRYNAVMPQFGYSESPLVVGDRVFAAPYGERVSVVALDKRTGNMIWESERLPGDGDYAGYVSFVHFEHAGFRQIVGMTAFHVYSLNADNGRLLWSVPFENNRRNNCTGIIYHDGHVFASSGYGRGAMLLRMTARDGGVAVERVYQTALLDNQHGGILYHDGHVYGSGHESRGWFALNFRTGAQRWRSSGKGSLTFADGMLYLYDEDGKVSLVRATPDRFTEISSFEVTPGSRRSQFWAHPVVSHGVLYIRHDNNLYAYAVR